MTVVVFDTSIGSSNLGDQIIMDAVNKEVENLFSSDMVLRSCTHMKMGKETYKMLLESRVSLIGGTNILSSNMTSNQQWRINFIDSIFAKKMILLGVGWWQYQQRPGLYTSTLLRRVLDRDMLHSVRDSYTQRMLARIGITNVINTGCPTLWHLTPKHCNQIPKHKSQHALLTLTDYSKDRKNDKKLIAILKNCYSSVYFWPQGLRDLSYFISLDEASDVKIVDPSLKKLNNLLDDKNISLDYVGTRLHAGIRALQKGRRSIIVGIDNRAIEKSKDFNLNVIPRTDINSLDIIIMSNFSTDIRLPWDKIEAWKGQFS